MMAYFVLLAQDDLSYSVHSNAEKGFRFAVGHNVRSPFKDHLLIA